MSWQFCGSGPGVQAPDGCSVEVYQQVPYFGEWDDFRQYRSGSFRVWLWFVCLVGQRRRWLSAVVQDG